MGYEIHYPAEYGEHVWDALMASGERFGIRPFGVEAQRVLRLQKQHIIVTHDTDALSTPVEANMAWIVKLEKEDFVGRPALERLQQRGPRQQLVGFRTENPHRVPPEGAAVVQSGKGVGRYLSGSDLRCGIIPSVVSETAAQTLSGVLTVESIYSRKKAAAIASTSPSIAETIMLRVQLGEEGTLGSSARWTICMFEAARSLDTLVSCKRLSTFS